MMSIHPGVTPRRQIQDNYVTCQTTLSALRESNLDPGLTLQMSRDMRPGVIMSEPGLLHVMLPRDKAATLTSLVT